MKRAYDCFEKGHGTHKKNLFSRSKLKPMYQTEIFLVGLTNSVLQIGKQFYKSVYQTSPN